MMITGKGKEWHRDHIDVPAVVSKLSKLEAKHEKLQAEYDRLVGEIEKMAGAYQEKGSERFGNLPSPEDDVANELAALLPGKEA